MNDTTDPRLDTTTSRAIAGENGKSLVTKRLEEAATAAGMQPYDLASAVGIVDMSALTVDEVLRATTLLGIKPETLFR